MNKTFNIFKIRNGRISAVQCTHATEKGWRTTDNKTLLKNQCNLDYHITRDLQFTAETKEEAHKIAKAYVRQELIRLGAIARANNELLDSLDDTN